MEYGCIGEKLGHSFSAKLHAKIGDYPYELCEIQRDDLDAFMKKKEFKAINVTIPYKETVIPYLYEIDEAAATIGSVNTVVNKNGRLFGYNTDFYGMSRLFLHAGIDPKGKKIAILGTGGTAKTAKAVARSLGASEILVVSRNPENGEISYGELYEKHADTRIIVNTTPVGMYPDIHSSPIELSRFSEPVGVLDAVYNPLRTELILDAKGRGIAAEGGLYMLVAQGVRASEIFFDTVYPDGRVDEIYESILGDKESVVLVGMPSSGKTTVGGIISERTGKPFIDTDALVTERIGMPIGEYFNLYGETQFRAREREVISDICSLGGAIIATGGGAVLSEENIRNLKRNGKIYFLDRPLERLLPTSDRPLASSKEDIEKRYIERYEIYKTAADVHIIADADAQAVAERIMCVK